MATRLLPYQREILAELLNVDALVVQARGLDLVHTAANYLKLFCTAQSLVLLVNATQTDQDRVLVELAAQQAPLPPKVITADTPASERCAFAWCCCGCCVPSSTRTSCVC